jgi:transposase
MGEPIIFVGLDVHKGTISVALAEEGRRGEVREYGRIANTPADLKKLLDKLGRTGHPLRFCYEAGPCGYGIQRQVTAAGHECVVVAPSLIPRKPGERIKTDRRDASNLARLHRAGELTAVWVPDPAHEALRDLVRARLAAVRALRQARQQLSGFLLRHGRHYNRPAWTLMHRRWLAGLRFEQEIHHVVLEHVEPAAAYGRIQRHHAMRAQPQHQLGCLVAREIVPHQQEAQRRQILRQGKRQRQSRLPHVPRRVREGWISDGWSGQLRQNRGETLAQPRMQHCIGAALGCVQPHLA